MCHPTEKINHLRINQPVQIDDSSIDYSTENENILTWLGTSFSTLLFYSSNGY